MKSQRDTLLEILASDVPFKGEISLVFDTTKETPEIKADHTGYVPQAEYKEQQAIATDLKKKVLELRTALEQQAIAAEVKLEESGRQISKTRKKRASPYNTQLSKEQVWDIRDYIKLGMGDAQIRDKMGNVFKSSAVWRIRNNLSYKKVGERPHPTTQKHTTVHAGYGVRE